VIRRNMGTVRTLFDDTQLPASTEELAADLRAAIARGLLTELDTDYAAHAMVAVGIELGERLIERDPPDVDGATAFAAGLFLGGLQRLAGGAGDRPPGPVRTATVGLRPGAVRPMRS
jgi:hypothetical protein